MSFLGPNTSAEQGGDFVGFCQIPVTPADFMARLARTEAIRLGQDETALETDIQHQLSQMGLQLQPGSPEQSALLYDDGGEVRCNGGIFVIVRDQQGQEKLFQVLSPRDLNTINLDTLPGQELIGTLGDLITQLYGNAGAPQGTIYMQTQAFAYNGFPPDMALVPVFFPGEQYGLTNDVGSVTNVRPPNPTKTPWPGQPPTPLVTRVPGVHMASTPEPVQDQTDVEQQGADLSSNDQYSPFPTNTWAPTPTLAPTRTPTPESTATPGIAQSADTEAVPGEQEHATAVAYQQPIETTQSGLTINGALAFIVIAGLCIGAIRRVHSNKTSARRSQNNANAGPGNDTERKPVIIDMPPQTQATNGTGHRIFGAHEAPPLWVQEEQEYVSTEVGQDDQTYVVNRAWFKDANNPDHTRQSIYLIYKEDSEAPNGWTPLRDQYRWDVLLTEYEEYIKTQNLYDSGTEFFWFWWWGQDKYRTQPDVQSARPTAYAPRQSTAPQDAPPTNDAGRLLEF